MRGVADALIAACADAARAHGAVELKRATASGNLRAQAVYERVGGVREARSPYSLPLTGSLAVGRNPSGDRRLERYGLADDDLPDGVLGISRRISVLKRRAVYCGAVKVQPPRRSSFTRRLAVSPAPTSATTSQRSLSALSAPQLPLHGRCHDTTR